MPVNQQILLDNRPTAEAVVSNFKLITTETPTLKEGEVLAAGPTAEVLTPEHIRLLYGVDAEVTRHPPTGRLVVVPIRRVPAGRGA